jgi:hypothetical protein
MIVNAWQLASKWHPRMVVLKEESGSRMAHNWENRRKQI